MESPLSFHPNSSKPSSNYKFEHGGLLVYDIKAKNSSSESFLKSPELSSKFTQKDLQILNKSKVIDYNQSLFLKSYPAIPIFPIDYQFSIPDDNLTLEFDSRFESGNLSKAIKMSDYDYKLYINNDIGTYNCNHWFYFSVKNPRKTSITFKIVNMRKKDILFQAGMKPAVYSLLLEQAQGIRWHREGTGISYTENISNKCSSHKSFTLSFTYNFKYENDKVFFAYAVPYTYSDLQDYLAFLTACYSDVLRVDTLCESLAGNLCQVVTITENISDYLSNYYEQKLWTFSGNNRKKLAGKVLQDARRLEGFNEDRHKGKVGIVFMARVHSGETVSSYMLKGAIDYLTSSSGRTLRKNFVFKIVPMLNPDGVRYGSYRNSLLGVDLNRRWHKPHKMLHPEIYFSKIMIKSFNLVNTVKMICDLHGHTKKFNVFMYGCCKTPNDLIDSQKNLMAKSIPFMFSTTSKFFSMQNSHFRIERYKETTARIVLFNDLDLPHSYTIESSFFGYQEGKKVKHFSETDLENIGKTLCKVCNSFISNKRYLEMLVKTNEYLRSLVFDCPKQRIRKTLSKCENLPIEPIEEENFSLNSEENSPFIDDSCSENLEFDDFDDDMNWLDKIDIVDIFPDSDSSGSESEISDSETVIKKRSEKIVQNFSACLSPPKSEKVHQPPRKTKMSKPSLKIKQVRNPESFNLNVFNFSLDLSEIPMRKSFEASKVMTKTKEQGVRKSLGGDGRGSFLLPVLKTNKAKNVKLSPGNARKEFSKAIHQAAKYIQSSSHFQGKFRHASV
jgi:hypothetical protein